jgi:branched-chain amino acid transport system permease protein
MKTMQAQAEEVRRRLGSRFYGRRAGSRSYGPILGWLLLALLLVGIAIVPLVLPTYRVLFLLLTFMYITLAASWNLISGFTGYVSFGHVAFFGLGAYTAAILITQYGVPWLLAALAGGVLAIFFALVLGAVLLRIKGPYFAIATLGLAEVMRVSAAAWVSVTGGGSGYYLPPTMELTPLYYAMAGLMLLVILVSRAVARSDFGLRLLSIREDERASEVMGINSTRHKIAAFMLSAFFPAVAGGFYAWQLSYIDPFSVFRPTMSVNMVIMTMLGGMGTVLGPVIGGLSLSLILEAFWARLPELHQAASGILIVIVLLFMPGGIVNLLQKRGIIPTRRGW